jgi:hypothetical protein
MKHGVSFERTSSNFMTLMLPGQEKSSVRQHTDPFEGGEYLCLAIRHFVKAGRLTISPVAITAKE